ncbi:DUF2384 domain-containing protein [Photobacterium profundum]|uniref:antitoxin Xre/MbcA/ParS toxin-binding domain-containing protein n=2 Tax=Photobacterium profundum TaxID=74109 RepID=UPI003D0C9996
MDNQKVIELSHALQDALPFGRSGINSVEQYEQAIELMNVLVEDATNNALFIDYLFPIIERFEDTAPEFSVFNDRIAKMNIGQTMLRLLMDQHHLKTSDFGNEIGVESIVAEIANGKRQLTNTHIRKLAARFGLSPAMFFDKLEDIELTAIAEERKGQPEIDVDTNELNNIVLVHSEVFTAALALFENDSHAAAVWLNNPVNGLGGRRPVDLLDTEDGTQAVLKMIGRLEHGVFS